MMMALGEAAREAAAELAFATPEAKRTGAGGGRQRGLRPRGREIIAANAKDIAFGREKGCRRR
jgi:glutamate-5-semialdehyde dehydrogenase